MNKMSLLKSFQQCFSGSDALYSSQLLKGIRQKVLKWC